MAFALNLTKKTSFQYSKSYAELLNPYGGFRHPYGGFRHPYGGFRHLCGGFRHPCGGFRHLYGGFRHPCGGFRHPCGEFCHPCGGFPGDSVTRAGTPKNKKGRPYQAAFQILKAIIYRSKVKEPCFLLSILTPGWAASSS